MQKRFQNEWKLPLQAILSLHANSRAGYRVRPNEFCKHQNRNIEFNYITMYEVSKRNYSLYNLGASFGSML